MTTAFQQRHLGAFSTSERVSFCQGSLNGAALDPRGVPPAVGGVRLSVRPGRLVACASPSASDPSAPFSNVAYAFTLRT